MKNLFVILCLVALGMISCSKNDTMDMVIVPPPPIDTTSSTIRYTGSFQNGPFGTTQGTAYVVETNGKLQLRLSDFTVNSGPDLKVYLSKEQQPLNFIRLSSLKALSGDQLYDIPGTPDFTQYRYALIHCEKFNHLFGSALLLKQ